MTRPRRAAIGLTLVLLGVLVAPRARAFELDVVPQTLFQALSLRDVRGFLRESQRLTQFLHLRTAARPDDHLVRFVASLRYDVDFAIRNSELRADPHLVRDRFDLLLGYADWRLPSRALAVRLGRQIDWQALGLVAYDGLSVEVRLPVHLALEASAGLRVRDRAWLGPSAYADELAAGATLAPTFGAGLALVDLARAAARLGWRRTFDGALVEERVHAAASGRPVDGLDLSGALDVDASLGRVGAARLAARYRIIPALDAELAYDLSRPRLAADSIFTVFDLRDRHAGRLGLAARPAAGWRLTAGYEYRRYGGDEHLRTDADDAHGPGASDAHAGLASVRWQPAAWLHGRLGLEGEWGVDGALGLADLAVRAEVVEDLLQLGGRAAARLYGGLTTARLAEDARGPLGFDAAAFTAVLDAEVALGEETGSFGAVVETSLDEFHRYLIRGYGLLTLELLL